MRKTNQAIGRRNSDVKLRQCLRCPKVIRTTKDWRLCSNCRTDIKGPDFDENYEGTNYGVLYDERGRRM